MSFEPTQEVSTTTDGRPVASYEPASGEKFVEGKASQRDAPAPTDDVAADQAPRVAGTSTADKSEKEKMLAGELYFAMGPELVGERMRAKGLTRRFNNAEDPTAEEISGGDAMGPARRGIAAELFGLSKAEIERLQPVIEPPIQVDYGLNTTFGESFYANYGLCLLDCARVTFGKRVLLGPNVSIYAATHPTDVTERQSGLELAFPVTVGDDAWIGGGSILVGPCTIGEGTTVAAGAVVTGNIEPYVVVGGVPAKVIKRLARPTAGSSAS